ncbi:MAG TPA: DNA-binding response regulator [Lachnospiraceae bacterium]|nr:DNA-binding response regulator [Lachnospiraceae bacterium]HAP72244.1 DNA-binding response regulator [Lachnospiraceae bacterium]
MKLLLAEDEVELSNALCAILKHAGYSVDAVYNGKDAYEYARVSPYDGLILDIMMPGMDGMEVLKTLRMDGKTMPALFLTARQEVSDRVRGLDLGADDYLTKPFDMNELLARIRAMLRRREEFRPGELTFGNVILDRSLCELRTKGHEPYRLSGKEFQMMEMLMEAPGRVISVETFMDSIWADGDADVNVVWVYISNLRRKLKTLDAGIEIRSSRGLGYSLSVLPDGNETR